MTPDLRLRPWAIADAEALREAIDEDVEHLRPWLTWTLEEPATLVRTRERLRQWVERVREGRAIRFAITPVDEPAHILGGAHLNWRERPAAYDLGYWVRASAARQGIATAAAASLIVHAFDKLDQPRLILHCDIANERSAAMAERLGFRFTREGEAAYPDGTPRCVRQFEMTRQAFHDDHAASLREAARRVVLDI